MGCGSRTDPLSRCGGKSLLSRRTMGSSVDSELRLMIGIGGSLGRANGTSQICCASIGIWRRQQCQHWGKENSPMNVLLVTEPGVDGVFRYVDTLCRYLWEQRVGVHLAYSDRRGSDRLFNLVAEVSERG